MSLVDFLACSHWLVYCHLFHALIGTCRRPLLSECITSTPSPYCASLQSLPVAPATTIQTYIMIAFSLACAATTWRVNDRGSAYASLHVGLDAGENIQAEPGSIVSYRGDVSLSVREGAGSWLGRIFAGELPWTTSIAALLDGTGAECMICPSGLGAIEVIELAEDEGIHLRSGSFLAADSTVEVVTRSHASLQTTFFSGSGLRHLQVKGPGTCAFNGHGALHCEKLSAGERMAVDNGHVVAWSPNLNMEVGFAAKGSAFRSLASGEGLMCFFEGPGEVWVQTHAPEPHGRSSKTK